ncbi:MAG TPA: winged helix-turn-helix domain-containing protein [Anaerolineae bacterium]
MLKLAPPMILLPRRTDLAVLFGAVRGMHCLSVVGISNLGKSSLLRSLADPAISAEHLGDGHDDYIFIYIDFNQMLEMTEQAFYELTLRCALEALRSRPAASDIFAVVQSAYNGLVAPASSFEIPLRFAQAMAAIGDQLPQHVVFLFDELDGPLARIHGRIFLNLRALKDHHWQGLTYITATNSRLSQIRNDGDVSEFDELFAPYTHYLFPLNDDETAAYATGYATAAGVTFSGDDLAFLRQWTGGHPGILAAVCRILGEQTGAPMREPMQDIIIHRRVADLISRDITVQSECKKIWEDLSASEQTALLWLLGGGDEREPAEMASVIDKHLVVGGGPERRFFARAFAEFVQRQQITGRPARSGLQLDVESGEVWINGEPVPTLTNLEYRLLLLLYGRLGKIVTKYDVVEAVWGEEQIDDVEDARIEKLISRLRQKIEPDANNPHYLMTVRGRGYKLIQV